MPAHLEDPMISPEALAAMLEAPDLRVLDASWGPPGAPADNRALYGEERIPGALFFDIDEIADLDDPLPHMLPPPEKFASRMRRAGVGDGAQIVVYDRLGVFSAARVWWMFRVMGKEDVRVLDGGLPAWKAAGLPIEDGPPLKRAERHFTARKRADLVRNLEEMLKLVGGGGAQILDARPAGRFAGDDPEPRPGLRLGHMPGATNTAYSTLLDETGRLKSAEALANVFEEKGVDLRRPIATTCGSGVSAAVIALALARLGRWDVPIYDGSWAEWGGRADTPVVTGPR